MSSNTLFLCNTPYQILFACNYIYQTKCNCDLILTDRIANCELLSQKLKNSGLFGSVYELHVKQQSLNISKKKKVIDYYIQKYTSVSFFPEIDGKKYDNFYFANFDYEITILWRKFLKNNELLKAYMFEDGLATYSSFYGDMIAKICSDGNFIEKYSRKRVFEVFFHIDGLLVFDKNCLDWNPYFPIIEIERPDPLNKDLIEKLNAIFGYDVNRNEYTAPVIFFEESYFADNKKIDDIEMVNFISRIVGKDNIIIKIHPRNNENRFKNLGYCTNEITSVPWEIIALNIDLTDKVLVTIASVSVITPCFLLGKDSKSVMLYNCTNQRDSLHWDIISTYENVISNYSESIHVPDKLEDVTVNLLG